MVNHGFLTLVMVQCLKEFGDPDFLEITLFFEITIFLELQYIMIFARKSEIFTAYLLLYEAGLTSEGRL